LEEERRMPSNLTKYVDAGASYLVTGGAGFIGSHLVEHLLEGGARVRVLDDFSTGRRQNLLAFEANHGEVGSGRFQLLEGDLTDAETCQQAMEGVNVVFHQAALPSVPRSIADPARSHAVNATGTLNILMAAKESGVGRVVYASSSSAYGDTPTLPKVETQTQSPRSPYAVAKLAGEQYCRAFAVVFGLETVALRYFNVFGPRQDPAGAYAAVIPLFASAAREGRSPTIDGDGGQTRDFTYIDNVVLANFLAATTPAEKVSGEVFNVGCGDRISINDLWMSVRDAVGAKVDAIHGPPRAGDVRDSLASLAHLKERTGYVVRVELEEGIEKTVAWISRDRAQW
jgi:nucleoside-diphosphate-sugar epimerase